jgi:hypothetical protein
MFQENLVHTSRVRRVDLNGQRLAEAAVGPRLPFLRDQTGQLPVRGRLRLDVRFADRDEDVSALYVGALSSRSDMTVTFRFHAATGQRVAELPVQVGTMTRRLVQPLEGVRARLLSIDVQSAEHVDARLTIGDLRVQGQSDALREYVRRHLRFPAP